MKGIQSMYKASKIGKEFSIFVKRHRLICILFLLCMFIIAKNSAIPAPGWIPLLMMRIFIQPEKGTTGAEWLSLMNNLSLAFIGSMITYVIIQYVPERRKAYRAYSILKTEICRLHDYMSYLIGMYLFEIRFDGGENDVTVERLSAICNVEITDYDHFCCIEACRNGNKAYTRAISYNLFKDSKKYTELILKAIDTITDTVCVSDLDPELLDILSSTANNRFIEFFSFLDVPERRTTGSLSYKVAFDKGFYNLVQSHIILNRYDFDQVTYLFSNLTDEEISKEREEKLFLITRATIKYIGVSRIKEITERIIALPPTETRLSMCVGVILEILVYYDYQEPKQDDVLECALRIAEYVSENEQDPVKADYALLNVMQIKQRLNTISATELEELQKMSSDNEKGKEIITGAAILCGDYGRAETAFNALSQKEKEYFIQLPIYRLWPDPPLPANLEPQPFN